MKQNIIFYKLSYLGILIFIISLEQTYGLKGVLQQINSKHLELNSDKDMIISTANPLTSVISIKITQVSQSAFTYQVKSEDKRKLVIELEYYESIIYQDLELIISIPDSIKDSDGQTFENLSYITEISYVFSFSDAEKTIQDIIPYILWVFFALFIITTVVLLLFKIDTVGIWIIIEFFQMCGLINYLNTIKSDPLIITLNELNRWNFFFIPTWFYNILNMINSSQVYTQSFNDIEENTQTIYAPTSTSFIKTGGNAICVVLVYGLLTAIFSCSKCVQLQKLFNFRSLYRLLDILLIHLVFASVINLRFYTIDRKAYPISDLILSILTLICYLYYSTLLPYNRVNNADIIMLNKNVIDQNKHFINKVRVEFFFSRNYFCIRSLFKGLFTTAIALGTSNDIASGVIYFSSACYFFSIFFLTLRYTLYDDIRLNALHLISTFSQFFLQILFIILWCFEQFYNSVSRSSSAQIDNTYIEFNHYISWSLICLLLISLFSFLGCLISYLYSSHQDKTLFLLQKKQQQNATEKTSNNLNEDLIDNNNVTIQNDNSKNQMINLTTRDIEMTRQQQQIQGQQQSQLDISQFESPQKLIKSQNKQPNSSGFQINMDSLLNTQSNQKQFQNNSVINPSPLPGFDVNYSDSNNININNNNNNQYEQDQDVNFRLQTKTSTFSASAQNNLTNQQ